MITNGVYFDNIHSFDDLGLILSAVEIPPAKAKTNYLDIPGADGSVDLTEALGEVKYNDRDGAKFTFTMNPDGDLSESAWEAKKTEISNLLNGKRCRVRLDKDPNYYYLGRCSVDNYLSDKRIRQIVVTGRFAPWKWKLNKTNKVAHFCGKNLFVDDSSKYTRPRDYFVCPIALEWGKTYTASVRLTGTAMTNIVVALAPHSDKYADFKDGMISLIKIGGSYYATTTFTVDETWTAPKLAIYSAEDSVASVFANYDIQLEVGSAPTAYEAYTPFADVQVITLTNARKTVTPEIAVTGEASVTFPGFGKFTLGAGTHKVLDFQLHEGETPVTVSGTGSIAFMYQEGDL